MGLTGDGGGGAAWQKKPMKQSVVYEDRGAVEKALQKLETLPPLVTAAEIVKLRNSLKEVALGNAFLLQGGKLLCSC